MDRSPRSQPADLRRDAVTVVRPDPEAWSLAVLYADGDRSRLVVVDERTVLVRNH